ncbi:MAG: 4-hydroxythreonine-4-phosphate dehydrogenase PdxA [Acidobacteria bacterium]|nr:4-hydroxythreonine-4-phosphate dehydrogenase PdxA [Acidobacteriota bacterium]
MLKIAVTMGEPAGIGPEIILKAIGQAASYTDVRFYVFGDATVLYENARRLGMEFQWPVVPLDTCADQFPAETCIVDLANVHGRIRFGVERADYGKAAMEYIEQATYFCLAGVLDALITAPINKKSIHLAGYNFPGHTEFLASLTGTKRFAMSFHADKLWTIVGTTHLPLSRAIRLLSREHVQEIIRLTYHELKKYQPEPAIAVASLNPHGAEGGLFGMEEDMVIRPAITQCQEEGIPVSGPYPADSIYLRALNGEFNVIITHYHDQGMIPVKLISFGKAVNITLGLPFLRTSVDHGTAFDIAGKGIASSESMEEAIRLTRELLQRQTSFRSGEGATDDP